MKASTEDTFLEMADHLPSEAAEALLELATGGTPMFMETAPVGSDPFEHPDALRRFRVMPDVNELQQALDYPWEKWSVFLHPAQRDMVERDFNGPARPGFRVPPVPAKLWWPCAGRFTWRAPTQTRGYC